MANVQVLPSEVIARIAAGEVVDRPSSVVKELMENSLDAGATRVEVNLSAGGKTLIEIRDDGNGIGREDMNVLFTRHATSKVRTSDDLDHILSFGFRGEALYSVGSVSELTLRSRALGAAEGFELKVKGGVKAPVQPAALATQGTHIRVEEVFFNTPARKKFLKSDASEFDQAAGVFLPYVLLHHDRHFILTHNGRKVYDLAPAPSPAERAARALALDVKHIVLLDEFRVQDLAVRAVLGDINIQRPRRDLQFVFVNSRPVLSKGLLFHMNDIYRLIMPEGVNPFFALFLTIPPVDVDVNIHPAKREVRIRDEARLGGLLRRSVEAALMTRGGARGVPSEVFKFEPSPIAPEIVPSASGDHVRALPESSVLFEGIPADRLRFSPEQKNSAFPAATTNPPPSGEGQGGGKNKSPSFWEKSFDEVVGVPTPPSVNERLGRARYVGSFLNKYQFFEEAGSLFVIDQHAAQERVMFERFTAQMKAGKVEVQRLLVPLAIRLSPRDMALWNDAKDMLAEMGFETDQVGTEAVGVQSHPRVIPCTEAVFRSLIGEGASGPSRYDALARRACRASVMSGDSMTAVQAEGQLKMLLACADPFTCPHGRPVFIEIRESFLDKQFFRT